VEQRDFIVTPIIIVIVYVVAYMVRPLVTDSITRKYYFSAFTVRIFGALAVGFIYQFYYHGGDTYNFHTLGSRHIWDAFMDSPIKGVEMLLADGEHKGSFYKYSSQVYFFTDHSAYFIVRLAAIFDLLTFSSYSATAVLFATIGFMGSWMLFLTFYRRYPQLHFWMAVCTLFIPSVFFWGSGLLKDTIVIGALGLATYSIDKLFFQKKINIGNVLYLLFSLWVIFSIKKFILQAYLPASIMWVYLGNIDKIKSVVLKVMLLPFVIGISAPIAYFSIIKVGEDDARYSIDMLAKTVKTTAIDIRYLSGKDAGSGYDLGELDGTFSGMLKLAPQAINVSLYRPYLWEVKNPLMLLSAVESLILLLFTIVILLKKNVYLFKALTNPDIVFCLMFSVVFAFAVGISTYNFGTLARYKIPLLPFFSIALILIFYSNRFKKLEELENTE
jgi:hypothetical protein